MGGRYESGGDFVICCLGAGTAMGNDKVNSVTCRGCRKEMAGNEMTAEHMMREVGDE